jgi:epoxide hydrolase
MPAEPSIHPFRIDVPQADLDDLKARLARTRWPDQLPGAGWDYGIPLDYVQELAGYWRTGYDWRVHEQTMNAFPQFTTAIDGQNIHFLHVRSTERDALPLIITHGWPGSVVEFMEIIGPLTDPRAHGADPADAFHLVIPSIPGFGFSGPTRDAGWNVNRIARAWDELMRRLGYPRYGAQGGDWGSSISRELGLVVPGHLIGVHLNMLFPRVRDEPADLTNQERARLQAFRRFRSTGSGYYAIQSTRPQTLAYGLTDSPAGQLAWIAEKFGEWTDDGLPDEAVGRDRLLTNVTLYWLTGTAGSSARLYYEAGRSGGWVRRSPRPCPPAWRSSRGRSHRRSGVWPSSPTTSCTGPSTTAAVTSPPWRYPISWSATCAHSSGGSAERSAARERRLRHRRETA